MTLVLPETPYHANDWSNDQVDLLRNLAAKNLSARSIAAAFPGKSRNAVLGKLNRLGLHLGTPRQTFWSHVNNMEKLKELYFSPLGYSHQEMATQCGIGLATLRKAIAKMRLREGAPQNKPVAPRPQPQPQPRSAVVRARRRAEAIAVRQSLVCELTPATDLSAAVTIMGLTPRTCRWPVAGEGHAMLYCGCLPLPGLPYCGPHARRSYA